MNLDEILGDKPIVTPTEATDVKPAETEAAAAPSAVTEAPKEAPQEQPKETSTQRDDKGRFAKPEPSVPVAALADERRKRQELEAELQRLREAKPKTDFFEDPNKAFEERIESTLTPWKERFFKLSIKAARAGRDDYEEVSEAFSRAADADPRLTEQLRDHDDPGEFIYSVGKQLKELSDVGGDIGKYRSKIESQYTTKLSEMETRLKALEAENKTLKESQHKQARVPQSLNSEQSAAASSAAFAGPRPLKAIIS